VTDRPTFDVLRLERCDGPVRTASGEPWVRWVHRGIYDGWATQGSRDASKKTTFWEVTFDAAVRVLGNRVDQVHCAGEGILSVGGLGVTLRSGYAQLLLHTCLVTDPAKFVDAMAPVFHATGAHTKASNKVPGGVVLADERGRPVTSEEGLRDLVLLGSKSVKWTNPQKQRARIWVSSISRLLRDERMDRAQVAFAEAILPGLLDDELKALVRWPTHGAEDTWQYTREHQALWAFCLVTSIQFPELVRAIITGAMRSEPEGELRSVLARVKAKAEAGPGTFQEKPILSTLEILKEGFGVSL